MNQFLGNGHKPCIFGRRLIYFAHDFKLQTFDSTCKNRSTANSGAWLMNALNVAWKLYPFTLIFLTLLSICAALASFIFKYIYYGKHSWWFDKLLRGQTYYRPYLTLGTVFSKSKWLTPWPRHRDGGRGKKDSIQILDVERDTDNALWVYWGRKGVVKVILNHQNWSWDRSFYWILSHKLSKKADSLYDKKIPQRITKKLRKIVVVFVVTAVPFRCFAISLQKKHCQFLFTWNKNSLDLWGIKTSILGG